MNRQQAIWFVAMLVGGALPLIALGYWYELTGARTKETLAVADACVDWAHKSLAERKLDAPDLIQRCNRYFQVRSDRDADEDDKRWKSRQLAKAGG
jgi:hypothetical protein